MKTLLWTVAILAGSALAATAQQSNVFVAVGSNGVEVRRPDGSLVTTLSGAPYNFNQPYDIVTSPGFDLGVVSNQGGGFVTIFNTRTFAHVMNMTFPNATSTKGMSVSGNGRFVYVATQRLVGPSAFASVFQIDFADLTPPGVPVGEVGIPLGNVIEDCVVVNSSAVGGSGGNGPGRVYFSVPAGNFLGIININPAGPFGSLDVNQAPAANINTPTQLERTPDHSAVFIGVTTNDGVAQQRIGRIAVNGNVLSQPVVRATVQSLPHQVIDIAFRPDGRGYINNTIDAGSLNIIEIDTNGVSLGVAQSPSTVPAAGRIRFDSTPEHLYIGETSGTSNQFGFKDASTQPVGATQIVLAGTGGPRAFAFAPAPGAPIISDVSPSGMVSAAGTVIEISGANFDPACVVEFYNQAGIPSARTVTFVHSGLLRVNGDGLAPELYEVRVTNPDAQNFRLVDYFVSLNPPPAQPPFQVTLPSRTEGYRLRAFPQYYNASDLLAAIEAQVGGYNPSTIRVFVQNGGGYSDLSQLAGSPRDLSGRSFWVLTRDGGPLSLSLPAVAPPNTIGDRKIVILEPGWNMISMPATNGANFSMDPNDIALFDDPALTSGVGSLATTPGAETSFPHVFSDGAYVALTATDDLAAGVGYWLRNNTSGPLYMRFLPSDATLTVGVPVGTRAPRGLSAASGSPDLPPPPPGAALGEDDGGKSGCGLPGLEIFALLALLAARGRRRAA